MVHCHLRWDFVWQRPQQLFSRLAAHHAVLFVEDPMPGEGDAHLDVSEPYANVVRLVPRLPHDAPADTDAQWRLLLPLIKQALQRHPLLAGRFANPVQWFYSPMSAPVLLGLGPSAIGSLPGGHAQNETDERRYREQVLAGHLPVVRGVAVTREDRQRAALIERLMCDFALDIDAQAESAPGMRDILDEGLQRMLPLCRNGLVRREGARLEVLPAGRRFVRQVAACFDAYLAPDAKRHSAAV